MVSDLVNDSKDGTLTGTIIPGHSGPGSIGNDEIFSIPQSTITRASLLFSVITRTLAGGVEFFLLCRDAAGVFYIPRRLGGQICLRYFKINKNWKGATEKAHIDLTLHITDAQESNSPL